MLCLCVSVIVVANGATVANALIYVEFVQDRRRLGCRSCGANANNAKDSVRAIEGIHADGSANDVISAQPGGVCLDKQPVPI